MCGIAGIIDLDGLTDPAAAERMADAIAHRGPDDRGSYSDPVAALAHLRLSIIDVSSDGHQPFADESGRYQLVFNGEIYNYLELRAELEEAGRRFRSQSDTEVLLQAYLEWGEKCQERLRGMWAFALWDARERRLFCSCDRFGIKPFYYRVEGGRLEFGSELKALLAVGPAPEINARVARDYLAYGRMDHDEETFVAGVLRLPAAHSLSFENGTVRVQRYWQLERKAPPAGDAAEAVRAAFLESMRLHLRSDVPIGTCLSGGIDSSAIVCATPLVLGDALTGGGEALRQRTFTVTFPGEPIDERRYAESVVAAVGALPDWVTFSAEEAEADLFRIVRDQDEPFGSTSLVAQWYVMRAARAGGVKVVLDGQGSDEIFAGYHTGFAPRMRGLLLSGRLRELLREGSAMRNMHGYSLSAVVRSLTAGLSSEGVVNARRARASGAAALLGGDLRDAGKAARKDEAPPTGADALHRYLHALLVRTQLPELLRYEDRNSMAHGIEARVPFLDHELVELAYSLPSDELLRGGVTKSVLRRALADLLPPAIRDRTDKIGFATPLGRYFDGALGDVAARIFASPVTAERGLVNTGVAQERLREHRSGQRPAGFELWRALNLELWCRYAIDRQPVDAMSSLN